MKSHSTNCKCINCGEESEQLLLMEKPIALLDGRDGKELKEWLKQNKQVKCVTRDRASAYAAAISEVLPDAMQIADRFHLHQNLLEAIKHTLNSTVPADIKIPKHIDEIDPAQSLEDECKKMLNTVNNSSEYDPKSVELYQNIQKFLEVGYSFRKIAKLLHHSRNTVKKYAYGT
ncbi:MAG: transposase [Eubacteriales bacterium]